MGCVANGRAGRRNRSSRLESGAHYPSVKITEIGCNISEVAGRGSGQRRLLAATGRQAVQLNSEIC